LGDERNDGPGPRCSSSALSPVKDADHFATLLTALAGEGYRVDASITVHSQSPEFGPASPDVLLELIIKQMCDDPDQVRIESSITKQRAAFDVYVSKRDFSKVIGSGGNYAYCLRTIFGAIYGRLGKKLHLMVVNPRRGK
jgi:predicted RNA-binding protein YlqC (UPF0109 family)